MIKSPMLASEIDANDEKFPKMGSGKIDGFRGVCQAESIFTRSNKPISNDFVRGEFELLNRHGHRTHGLDGELVVGDPSDPKVFQGTSGALRAKAGTPDFTYFVFDDFTNPDLPFVSRLDAAARRCEMLNAALVDLGRKPRFALVQHERLADMDDLLEMERRYTSMGWEGLMARDPIGPYKFGRSTAKEGLLLKLKRFSHSEARIVGYEELMHNHNEAYIDELGRTKRSDHKENKVPSGMIGAYICEMDEFPGVTFKVSCGSMDHKERRERLASFDRDRSEILRFKWFRHGTKDRSRHGLFDGFRSPDDV